MKVLRAVATQAPAGVVVGDTSLDDAVVLRWPHGSVNGPYLVQTIDFITPVVDDPRTFGAIAAANALSDIYSMGGTPRFALAIAGFPSGTLPLWVLEEILAGGAAKVAEAGGCVVGGHTIVDREPKYGLAVTGEVMPDALVTQSGAEVGDALVLCKPLGTGLLIGALRKGDLDPGAERALIASMTLLNEAASRHMVELGAHACTDVTGYGLLGHAQNVAQKSNVDLVIESSALPLLPFALGLAEKAAMGGAAGRNLAYVEDALLCTTSSAILRLAVDPQTSGGLLISLPRKRAEELVSRLADDGVVAALIGAVVQGVGGIRLDP